MISRYLVNKDRLVSFRTTLRGKLVPTKNEVGQIVAAAGMAPAAGHTLVPYQCLQEAQSFQCKADGGLGHIQTGLGNPPERGECAAFPTGTAVQIQQRDKGSRSQIIGKNVPADQSVAAFPAEPKITVGGIDQMVLLLIKMIAVALEQVALGTEFLHSLLCGSGTALAEPGKSGKGSSYILALPTSQKEQDKGHPLGGVGQIGVCNQVVGYSGNGMQVGHLYSLLSTEFIRIRKSPGQRMAHPMPWGYSRHG